MHAIPLSLYIHFPWCIQKCPYCDFNSHTLKKEYSIKAYIEALIKECDLILPYVWGRPISTIFIGGGTPSLIPPENLQDLFSQLRARFNLSPFTEITLEANPGTADQSFFSGYSELGVNRLSLGIQSFNDQYLKKLGRIHNKDQALTAIEMAQKSGFEKINIDLMFALPEQTLEDAILDLQTAFLQGVEHISYYQLTLEPNTYFHRYPPTLPRDELIEEIELSAHALFQQNGFQQYEVSAFAKHDEARCKHNLNYWSFGDYIGIGAGAHGKISIPNEQAILRTVQQKQPNKYIEQAGLASNSYAPTYVKIKERPFEFMLNALRLKEGIEIDLFSQRTFLPFSTIDEQITALREEGLLTKDLTRLQASPQGFLYLNQLISRFLSP